MKITAHQYDDAKATGFTARYITIDGFAAACFDMNSYDDLKNCRTDAPDPTDMNAWSIDADTWRSAQVDAIELAMFYYENDTQ